MSRSHRPETVWVLGDQLNRALVPLADADPAHTRVLLVESAAKLASRPWHVQRAHLVIAAVRRFAAELAAWAPKGSTPSRPSSTPKGSPPWNTATVSDKARSTALLRRWCRRANGDAAMTLVESWA